MVWRGGGGARDPIPVPLGDPPMCLASALTSVLIRNYLTYHINHKKAKTGNCSKKVNILENQKLIYDFKLLIIQDMNDSNMTN